MAATATVLACAGMAAPAWSQVTQHSLQAHLTSLGSSYPVQDAGDVWTFRNGSSTGALFANSGANYLGPAQHQQIGALITIGSTGCTPGFCVVPQADTLATFDGVFVHPGSSAPTVVVYRFDTPAQLVDLQLWTEGVANSANGNGIDVTVGVVRGGLTSVLDTFSVSHANTVSSALVTSLQPGLAMQAGDTLQVMYGGNGSYLFDHYNVEVQFTTSPVPEPSTAALWLTGLAGFGWLAGRRRRRTPVPA